MYIIMYIIMHACMYVCVTTIDNHDNTVVGLDIAVYFFGNINNHNSSSNSRSSNSNPSVCHEGSDSVSDENPRRKRS